MLVNFTNHYKEMAWNTLKFEVQRLKYYFLVKLSPIISVLFAISIKLLVLQCHFFQVYFNFIYKDNTR